MEGRARTRAAIFILCSILLPLASAKLESNGGLRVGFYDKTCPRTEEIVAEGCDASILLDAIPSGEETEKESVANSKSLRGLEVFDAAKDKLESECPGIVSCANTLTFAARDGSVLAGVPHYPVAELFVRKALTQEEMGYNETHRIDPKLDAADASKIISTCQQGHGSTGHSGCKKQNQRRDQEKNCRFVSSDKTVVNSGNADASGKASDSSNTSDIGKNLPSSNISSSEVIPSDSIGSAQDFIKSMP
ncbi:hypothetical protein Acr_07g0016070 [Actinidia rufa]|uniref:peroxidase n=1 Tax=Actinidia rufa TaxID=165716 RepID=A0A7J0EY90_9ERIC|nr:hypothetical protein Acr_07g0016070 [Actinidia rufa]